MKRFMVKEYSLPGWWKSIWHLHDCAAGCPLSSYDTEAEAIEQADLLNNAFRDNNPETEVPFGHQTIRYIPFN